MNYLIYSVYFILPVCLLWGAKVSGRGQWNEGFMSLKQTKALQGFFAICIMLHHISQKTCASWLSYKKTPGLELFVDYGYYFVGIFLFCSGYGLLKSYREKPNYLQGFFKKRVFPVVLAFYSTGIIFLIARILMGEQMNPAKWVFYLTGLWMPNPNTWFVIALPFLYLFFYLAFRFCKKENGAVLLTCLGVFLYTLLGTFIDHNNWWMRGEWWYNSVHFFSIGLLFACYENKILTHIKKHYVLYMCLAFVGIFLLDMWAKIATGVFSYYGEQWGADHVVLRRWACLIAQILASCAFVFFVFMLTMKVKIGNRLLAFMGGIAFEFYLIHGLFLELFSYRFVDIMPGLYHIKNVALLTIVVLVPSIPAAMLLQKFHRFVQKKIA